MTTTAQLRELLAKATPGPWTQSGIDVLQVHHTTRGVWYLPRSEADVALIVAAVNNLDALLKVVEAAAVVSSQRNGPYLMADMDATMEAENALKRALDGLNNNDKETK